MITVVLLNYQRPDNLHRIITAIKSQTEESTIFLWNNGALFDDNRVDWQIDSNINRYCRPRWFMASHAETDFVCVIDDDLCFADDRVLEDSLNAIGDASAGTVVGMTGVILKPHVAYRDCIHLDWLPRFPDGDTVVDIVKGRFMVLRTCDVAAIDFHAIDPVHDDIAVSALVGDEHLVPGSLRGRFTELPQRGVGLGIGGDWLAAREHARQHYFGSGTAPWENG